ncbi:MAG: VanZ family protein [Burkholderiales bacterium]|nr:VanZ family protein [Burkholderiales bacterium]
MRNVSSRGLLVIAAAGYSAFVIYGSLVPLRFEPMSWSEALAAFSALDLGGGPRIDWATNVVLGVPLGFFWAGVMWPAQPNVLRLPALALALLCALAVSVAAEFGQLFFAARTSSLNDIVAQLLGEIAGITLWWHYGTRFVAVITSLPLARGRMEVSERLLLIYLFVLLGYNVLPLDLSLHPLELYRKWRSGGVVLVPFTWAYASQAQRLYELVSDVVLWIPAAFLWRLSSAQPNLEVWKKTVAAAATVELAQLFVMSRVSDSTDIVLAALGAALGIIAGQGLKRADAPSSCVRAHRHRPVAKRLLPWVLALLAWLGVLAMVFWYPFDFDFDASHLRKRILMLKTVPLEVYWKGSPFRAVTEVLHKTGFMFPLGVLLGGLATSLSGRVPRGIRHAAVVLFIVATACAIEAAQLALPRKTVDLTDWMLEVAGGVAGYVAMLAVYSRVYGFRSARAERGGA